MMSTNVLFRETGIMSENNTKELNYSGQQTHRHSLAPVTGMHFFKIPLMIPNLLMVYLFYQISKLKFYEEWGIQRRAISSQSKSEKSATKTNFYDMG